MEYLKKAFEKNSDLTDALLEYENPNYYGTENIGKFSVTEIWKLVNLMGLKTNCTMNMLKHIDANKRERTFTLNEIKNILKAANIDEETTKLYCEKIGIHDAASQFNRPPLNLTNFLEELKNKYNN